MRRMRWSEMDEGARTALCARGLSDIFDPALRASIAALIEDVRVRGDAAVVEALARFDGVELAGPSELRISADEIAAATVTPARRRRAGRRDRPLPGLQRAADGAGGRLELRGRAWVARRREGHADRLGRAVRAIGQGQLPERRLPTRRAGDGRRRAERRALVVPPMPGAGGAVDPAVLVVCRKLGISDVFRANGPAGLAALAFGTATIPRVRKIVGPGSPAVTCAQVELQRHGVATMMVLGPTESLVIADDVGRSRAAGGRPPDRGRARHRLVGRAGVVGAGPG